MLAVDRISKQLRKKLAQSEFARNVLTVMTGTAVAQAIPVLLSLFLTRLYTPADFGGLAIFVSVVTICGLVATGRYELAILIPRRDREAFNILEASVALVGAFSVFGLVAAILIEHWFATQMTKVGLTRSHVYLLPLSTFLLGTYQSLNYWLNRLRRYRRLASARVYQALAMGSVQLVAGIGGFGSNGLVGGYVVGQVFALGTLALSVWPEWEAQQSFRSWRRTRAAARRQFDFPKFLIPGQLANVTSSQLPVLLLSAWFPAAVTGSYSLADRVLVLPLSLIGTAIGDVYRQQAAATYQVLGNCRELFVRTAARLAMIAVIPLVVTVGAAPWLFVHIFGRSWLQAGEITQILGCMVFFQLISSPLSQTVYLAEMYRADLIWQLVRLLLAGLALYFGHLLSTDFRVPVALYAASLACLHVAHSVLQYRAASGLQPSSQAPRPELVALKGR